jgi:hypothetical protein
MINKNYCFSVAYFKKKNQTIAPTNKRAIKIFGRFINMGNKAPSILAKLPPKPPTPEKLLLFLAEGIFEFVDDSLLGSSSTIRMGIILSFLLL